MERDRFREPALVWVLRNAGGAADGRGKACYAQCGKRFEKCATLERSPFAARTNNSFNSLQAGHYLPGLLIA